VKTALTVLRKDLLLELRTFETVPAMALFSLSSFVIFHFALNRASVDGQLAGGGRTPLTRGELLTLLRLSLTGGSLPGNLGTMSPEERLAWANQRNQTYVNAHRDDSMETLGAHLSAAHQDTLDLLGQFTDEQQVAPVSPSLMTNMNAGNLFIANAQHAAIHKTWIEEGFRQGL